MSEVFRRLLKVRGFGEDFLHPKYENMGDPQDLPDMREAVERMKLAGERGEKVVVYGDYDVDGVCAATVMRQALLWAGVEEVEILLPDRFGEGYGMNMGAVKEIEETGAKLVVTVDCGTRDGEVIEKLKEKGIEVIVTDHHETGKELPKCLMVNPKLGKVGAELCGAGVAFEVARAIRNDGQEKWLLDLVAIATVCDSMPLRDKNRILSYYGMKVLAKTRRPGLRELMKRVGVKRLDTHAIGFLIGPRLNAGGRMESAYKSLELLMCESKMEAVGLVEELEVLNTERRRVQNEAVAEVEGKGSEDKVVVVRGTWHEGVIGIIAGRLTERWRRPCFVFTEVEGGLLKGSARSFGEFNLAEAVSECQDCLVKGGGHNYAAGMTIASERFEELRERLNKYYDSLGLKNQERFFDVREDVVVEDLAGLNVELMDELRELEPYGEENEEPVFLLRNMLVNEKVMMGGNADHLRLTLRDDQGHYMKCVGFYAREEWCVEAGERANVWVKLEVNEWNGAKAVEGMIIGVERAGEI